LIRSGASTSSMSIRKQKKAGRFDISKIFCGEYYAH
jgi:hypothetical protein